MTISSTTLEAFTQATAAKEPVPGGGAVAAVTLAHAASLTSMVVAFSQGKPSFSEHEEFLAQTAHRLEEIRSEALALADRDADAFEALAPLFKMKNDDPNRSALLLPAVSGAIAPPTIILALAHETASLSSALLGRSSKMLKSDLAIGARLAAAAADAAAWNIRINLPLLLEATGDAAEAVAERQRIDEIVKHTGSIAEDVAASCSE